MAREYKVLSVLYQAFPYAPRAYLYCDDPSIIGADFFVMERHRGLVVRQSMPPEFSVMPDASSCMSEALVDALAEFHAVDYQAIGLGDLGEPDGFIARQIEGWYKRWHAAKTEDSADMETAYTWLKSHQPPTSAYSLVHNDYKLDNIMFDLSDPGKLVAIFDWDMCTLGDPLNDLGALLTYCTEPTDPPYFQKAAAVLAYPVLRRFRRRLDHRRYNGASLLGLRGIVIKSHGAADALALENAIGVGYEAARQRLLERTVAAMQPFVAQLEREQRRSAAAA